jgi:hypothetical protein
MRDRIIQFTTHLILKYEADMSCYTHENESKCIRRYIGTY